MDLLSNEVVDAFELCMMSISLAMKVPLGGDQIEDQREDEVHVCDEVYPVASWTALRYASKNKLNPVGFLIP